MARVVRRHPDFLCDLREQVAWLEEHRDVAWIEDLRHAVDEATHAVARLPSMGALVPPAGGGRQPGKLRKLVLRRVPFVIWYAVGKGEVWFLRLFHARQQNPHPRRRARRGR